MRSAAGRRRHGIVAAMAVLVLGMSLGASIGCSVRRPPDGATPAEIDAWITEEVRSRLAASEDVTAADLDVETRDGVVVLSGIQSSLEEVRHALEIAGRVRGVRQVVNRIHVMRPPARLQQVAVEKSGLDPG